MFDFLVIYLHLGCQLGHKSFKQMSHLFISHLMKMNYELSVQPKNIWLSLMKQQNSIRSTNDLRK